MPRAAEMPESLCLCTHGMTSKHFCKAPPQCCASWVYQSLRKGSTVSLRKPERTITIVPPLAFTNQLQHPESILFINKRIYQLCGRNQEAGNLERLRTPSFTNSPMTDFMLPGQAGPGYPRVARWHRLCGVVAQESALPWIGKGCQGADGA